MTAAEQFAADVDSMLSRWDAVNRHNLAQARELTKQISELADSMQATLDNVREIRESFEAGRVNQ